MYNMQVSSQNTSNIIYKEISGITSGSDTEMLQYPEGFSHENIRLANVRINVNGYWYQYNDCDKLYICSALSDTGFIFSHSVPFQHCEYVLCLYRIAE